MLSCAPLALADAATQQVLLYSRLINPNEFSARSAHSYLISPPVRSEGNSGDAFPHVFAPVVTRIIALSCRKAGATVNDDHGFMQYQIQRLPGP